MISKIVALLIALSCFNLKAQAGRRTFDEYPASFGLQLSTSLSALGRTPLIVDQGDRRTTAFHLSFEYQPAFIQKYGVLGIGPTFTIYPVLRSSVTTHIASLASLGGIIRYQAVYFRKQFLVPMVAYSFEHFAYHFNTNSGWLSGSYGLSGLTAGLGLNLNIFDPVSAARFYINQGIMRTYAIFEAKFLQGSDGRVPVGGHSYFFGVRFEF